VYACVVTRPAWRAEDSGHRAEVVFRNFHQASATAPALALGGRLAHEAAVRLRALQPAVHCLAWLATHRSVCVWPSQWPP